MKKMFIMASVLVVLVVPGAASAQDGKTTICHFPPGNPSNAQTITVDDSALPAHFAHGDITAADAAANGLTCQEAGEQAGELGPTPNSASIFAALVAGWGGLMLYWRARKNQVARL